MPQEGQAADLKYLIKSDAEVCERNVGAESEYPKRKPRLPQGSRAT
jgi:hypothetical protein